MCGELFNGTSFYHSFYSLHRVFHLSSSLIIFIFFIFIFFNLIFFLTFKIFNLCLQVFVLLFLNIINYCLNLICRPTRSWSRTRTRGPSSPGTSTWCDMTSSSLYSEPRILCSTRNSHQLINPALQHSICVLTQTLSSLRP